MKPVFVGIDPGNRFIVPLPPQVGSGAKLVDLCGVTSTEFDSRFDRVNLYSSPGKRTAMEDAVAASNLSVLLRGRRVVLLGRRVAAAFGVHGPESMSWGVSDRLFTYLVIPHPSGRCRFWNDPSNRNTVRRLLFDLGRVSVYVEGPDGSGKTSLVEVLSDTLGPIRVIPTSDPPKTTEVCLSRIAERLEPGILCDRFSGLISELVYGPVLRGSCKVPENDLWSIVKSVVDAGTVFVYCRPLLEVIKKSHKPRPGEDPSHVEAVSAKIQMLTHRYDDVMDTVSRLRGKVVRFDFTVENPDKIREFVRCAG